MRKREVALTSAPHLLPLDEMGLPQLAVPAVGEASKALSFLSGGYSSHYGAAHVHNRATPANLAVSTALSDSFRELGNECTKLDQEMDPVVFVNPMQVSLSLSLRLSLTLSQRFKGAFKSVFKGVFL